MYEDCREPELTALQHIIPTSSLFQSFSPPSHERLEGGLEETGVGSLAAAAVTGFSWLNLRTVGDDFQMEWKRERYVI